MFKTLMQPVEKLITEHGLGEGFNTRNDTVKEK